MARAFTNNFQRDASRVPLVTSSGILTRDATGTPKNSPLAIDTTVITLTVPATAAEIVLKCDVALRISEEATAASYYYVQAAGQAIALGLANSTVLYVRTDSGSGTLNFYFNTI